MTKVPYETQSQFFAFVCAGVSLKRSAVLAGVSRRSAQTWWKASGLVEPTPDISRWGGLPGTGPADVPRDQRRAGDRSRRPLTSEDRAVIAAGLRQRLSYAQIGGSIGRSKSVISREIARNRGPDGSYWGAVAHRVAHERRRRPKPVKLATNAGLCRQIEDWMDQGWSPGLIDQVLAKDHPPGSMDRVSKETIYQTLYVQTRGQLRADLYQQLSLSRARRKPRNQPQRKDRYADAFKIKDRPAEVDNRTVPGHWEGDLILGAACRSAIGTLVERTTRFTILLHLPDDHEAETVAAAMIAEMNKLPEHLRRSMTWDRGSEMAEYADIQTKLQMPVYLCDPRSPWQRGTNENTNRLLRHWFAKGTDLSIYTADDLRRVAATLNHRPRPTLELRTPAQALNQLLLNPAA